MLPASEREDAPRVVLVDATDRNARDDTLRYRTAVLDAHADAASDGVLVVDADKRVVS